MSDTVVDTPKLEEPKDQQPSPKPPPSNRRYLPNSFGVYLTDPIYGEPINIEGTLYVNTDNPRLGHDAEGRYRRDKQEYADYDSLANLKAALSWSPDTFKRFVDHITNLINRQ